MGIVRRPRKEVQGYFQYMELNKKFFVQFEDRKFKDMSTGKTMFIAIE